MKFNIKNLKGTASNDEVSSINNLNILDTIDYKSLLDFYHNKDYNDLYNVSINQYNTNIGIINSFLKTNIKILYGIISNDNLVKINKLLTSDNLPDSIVITGYNYTNLNVYLKINVLMVKIIDILDDTNNQINKIIFSNNETEASFKIDTLHKKFEEYIKDVDKREFYDMIAFGFPDKNIKVDNKEYFRDKKSSPYQIEITKDEYYNIYRDIIEHKKYADNINKYFVNIKKMSNGISSVLYNKEIKSKYDSLTNDSKLKKSLNKIILSEGKFIGHISVFISKFITFQTDAVIESLKQDMNIINTIVDGVQK